MPDFSARPYPTALVTTPLGEVEVVAYDLDHFSLRASRERPFALHGVPYSGSVSFTRDPGCEWRTKEAYLSRTDCHRDVTYQQVQRVVARLLPFARTWAATAGAMLNDADRVSIEREIERKESEASELEGKAAAVRLELAALRLRLAQAQRAA